MLTFQLIRLRNYKLLKAVIISTVRRKINLCAITKLFKPVIILILLHECLAGIPFNWHLKKLLYSKLHTALDCLLPTSSASDEWTETSHESASLSVSCISSVRLPQHAMINMAEGQANAGSNEKTCTQMDTLPLKIFAVSTESSYLP